MKKLLIVILILQISLLFLSNNCFGKITAKDTSQASCSNVGQLECPQGFRPNCPEQYTPSCVFVGTMYLPSCLASSADDTVFNYRLDKISCTKGK